MSPKCFSHQKNISQSYPKIADKHHSWHPFDKLQGRKISKGYQPVVKEKHIKTLMCWHVLTMTCFSGVKNHFGDI